MYDLRIRHWQETYNIISIPNSIEYEAVVFHESIDVKPRQLFACLSTRAPTLNDTQSQTSCAILTMQCCRALRSFKDIGAHAKAQHISVGLSRTFARHKSGPYGYTQSKALVFSKYGEPENVLS